MARVKGAMMTRKRRNKILKLAKGYWGAKSKHFKMANEQVMKSLQYCRLQDERHELLHLYARPEAGWRGDQPQDALRAGCQRQGCFHPAHRDG